MFLLQECIYLPDLVGFPCRPQNPVLGSWSEGASPGSFRSWQDKPPFLCTQARSDLWCPGRCSHPAHPQWPGGVGAVPGPVATSTLPSPVLPVPDISLTSGLTSSGALSESAGLAGAVQPPLPPENNCTKDWPAKEFGAACCWGRPSEPTPTPGLIRSLGPSRCLELRTGSAEPGVPPSLGHGLQETSEQPAAEVTKCFQSQQITSIKVCGSDRFQPCSNIGFFNF